MRIRRTWIAGIAAASLIAAACAGDDDTSNSPPADETPTDTSIEASEPETTNTTSTTDASDTSTAPESTESESGDGTGTGGSVERIATALEAEGGEVTLYWPANANFQAFIDEDLVPGFEQHVSDVYGVDIDVRVLEASGGDGSFLDRLTANAGRDGFGIDVARTAPSDALIGAMNDGLLTALSAHPDEMDNLASIDPDGLAVFELDDGEIYGVPIYRPTMSLFYNQALVDEPPTDLAGLLAYAEANPGEFTYEDPRSATGTGSGTMFLLSVMHALGDETDPSTWADGWDYLASLQDVIAPQPQAGDQMVDLFQRGEILMMPYWNDAGLFAKEDLQIDDMANTLLDDGFPIRFTPFVVPAGASNPIGALLLTNYMIGPEMQVRVAERMRQIPSSLAPEVVAVIEDETFGFAVDEITNGTFAAYNTTAALAAITELNAQFDTEVLGR